MALREEKSKLLLHVCCAVCACGLAEKLKNEYQLTLFFYNPNIQPKGEYEKRKEAVKKLAEIEQLAFIEGKYEPERWLEAVRGYEKEPEGGKRCSFCFKERLAKTAKMAKEKGFDYFSSTLSTSPYKDERVIEGLAKKISQGTGIVFLGLTDLGLDKKENWLKSRALAKKFGFYHQNYCGCLFSQRN